MTTGTSITQKVLEAVNRHDPAGYAALFAEDAVLHDPQYPEALRGRDAIAKDLEDMIRAFPDLRISITNTVESGDQQATEWKVSGTNEGPIPFPSGEVPATGKRMEFNGSDFARYNASGEIVETRRYYDIVTWMQQLGLAE